jgi:hypothetical protein
VFPPCQIASGSNNQIDVLALVIDTLVRQAAHQKPQSDDTSTAVSASEVLSVRR